MEAKITIARDSNDQMRIQLIDASSKQRIFEGALTLASFARAISGESRVPVQTLQVCNPNEAGKFGLHRIVRNRTCEKVSLSDARSQEEVVIEDFKSKWQPEGWTLFDDGMGSQQPGSQHNYIVCRWYTDAELEAHGLVGEIMF